MFISNESVSDDYSVDWGERLGCGMNGSVRSATKRSTGEKYAVKVIRDRPRARAEIEMHAKVMDHVNIVNLHEVYCNELKFPGESDATSKLILILERMQGGELFTRISDLHHFTEKQAVDATRQITAALLHLHVVHNVAHRDLKPENLLYDNKSESAILKLCDFGFAKVDNGDLGTPQFTPYYASPQVLEAQRRYKHHSRDKSYTYSKSCDMWSLGVIIYILLCGYPPFFPSHPTRKGVDRVMKKRIQLGEFQFPREEWEMVSDNAKNLIRGLLTVDQDDRLTIEQVLNHPWLVEAAPEIPLQSPLFIKSKDAVATALAAGNRRLRAIDLKPVADAVNPIMIRSKQRQISNNINNDNYQNSLDDKPSNPSVLIKEIRLALSHLLNLLRLPETERVNSEYYLSFKEVIARIPQLEKYYFYEALSLNNSTAYAIKQVLINLPEYSR